MDKRLNLRAKTKKLLEENRDTTLFDISLGNYFSGSISLDRSNQNKRMEIHQTKTFLQSKRNLQQNEKAICN